MQTMYGQYFLNQIQIIHSASTSADDIKICIKSIEYDE